MSQYGFAVIGAGIAGASLAAELAEYTSVLLLEAEERPDYHATGRSAAFWEECYGGPDIVPLTLASGSYLREHGFLSERGALYIGRNSDRRALDAFIDRFAATGATLVRLDRDALAERLPGLKPQWTGAVWEPACADIDVATLHAHYLKLAGSRGVKLVTRARVAALLGDTEGWTIRTEREDSFRVSNLANAAGAWADEVAAMAGVRPRGIRPLRRTVAQLRVNPQPPPDLPLVLDIAGRFYFKSESGRLWLSPHDETPTAPCDAAPEEIDVALAIERLGEVTDWRVERVEHRWAGLRSFSPDRLPVYGWDGEVERFAWFAGQGGYGIQTAPAAARLAAQLLLGKARDCLTRSLDAALYAPGRNALKKAS